MPIRTSSLLTIALLLAACGKEPEAPAPVSGEAASAPEMPARTAPAGPGKTPAPAGARVFFISPADGDVVSSPVTVEFGIEGMTVARAGDDTPDSGHHHLLIDTGLPDLNLPVPADANHVHFGDASTSTVLELEPGEHTLTLLLGDYLHRPHEPPVLSEPITITVE